MNKISELTREMIVEYESIIGRKLTPQEYLQFRDQAMREIQNGFAVNNVSTQQITSQSPIAPIISEQKALEQNFEEPVGKTAEKEPILISGQINTPAKISVPKKKEEKKEEPKQVQTEEIDPFFALVDKMEA